MKKKNSPKIFFHENLPEKNPATYLFKKNAQIGDVIKEDETMSIICAIDIDGYMAISNFEEELTFEHHGRDQSKLKVAQDMDMIKVKEYKKLYLKKLEEARKSTNLVVSTIPGVFYSDN